MQKLDQQTLAEMLLGDDDPAPLWIRRHSLSPAPSQAVLPGA
jgi:hypothetical protein